LKRSVLSKIMNQEKQNILVYPRRFFTEDLLHLKKSGEMLIHAVFHETSEENQWLVRKFNREEIQKILQERQSDTKSKRLLLSLNLLKNRLHPDSSPLQVDYISDGHLYLSFDSVTKINNISGYFRHCGKIVNLDRLFLVGAEMQKILSVNSKLQNFREAQYEKFLTTEYARTRWAMTCKALGEKSWRTLNLLRFLIIGGGRSGESAFLELARLGVGQITICDGDDLELGNLGEMKLATDQDIGRNKAEIIVEKVTQLRQTNQKDDCFDFRAVTTFNFEGFEARQTAKNSDVIICCLDSEGGRSYASNLAARFYKVLLDIGTGILSSGVTNEIGYDDRLILPDDGCLRCCGGIDEEQSELEIFSCQMQKRQRQEGKLNRNGSLSRINNIAVSRGIKLLQDLCGGLIKNSTWVQYEENKGETIREVISKIKTQNCYCKNAGAGILSI